MLDAIVVSSQNFHLVQLLVKDALWAAEFKTMFDTNLANGEITYVIAQTRQTGFGPKTFYTCTTYTKFNETFKFVAENYPFDLAPITKK